MNDYIGQINTMSPSVSVRMICYNHGKYVRQAIESVLKQKTTFPFHIVIHDDASTDGSADIIRSYAEKYPDLITAILQTENQFQQGNSILRFTEPYTMGKYLAMCECDDYWLDDCKLQKEVDYLEHHPECAVVYTNILPVDENGDYKEELRGIYPMLPEGNYTAREIKYAELKTQTATLVMRNLFLVLPHEKMEIYHNAKCNGDVRLLAVAGRYGTAHYLSDVTAAHRRVFGHGDSYTARQNRLSEYDRFISSFLQRLAYYDFIKEFFGKNIYHWNDVLRSMLISRVKYQKTFLKHPEVQKRLSFADIPFYAYPVFFLFCVSVALRKAVRMVKSGFHAFRRDSASVTGN